ncbi:MAG: type IV secretion system DNA-binding domain-containing protein [Candidatus Pacebacteria bacterium]|nr:type IV secretion system DNA-binding domain-containing protein [Candidatus Paceibacterota bacterium]
MIEENANQDKVNYFAMTDVRGERTAFGIKPEDRLRHMYIIGKTGMGKSTMLENMAIQDIQNGEGMCFIDPHGSSAEKLLEFIPQERIKDVLYFAPFDTEHPIGFNVMEDVGYENRHLVVAGLMSSFKRIWVDTWSSRMEYILQNVLLALLEYPDSTLVDINRMLINKEFRNKVLDRVTDPIVVEFWKVEFAGYTDRYAQEATPAIQNKIGQFVANPLVRNIVAQPDSTFNIRELMDNKKIFIVNLSKGRMGEQNADLVGSMLVTKMYLSAMSRAEESAETLESLSPFYLYVDEFQSVVNDSFTNILSEARKYKLSLIIAHQYVAQMEDNIRDAVFGNVGTTITFRVGPFDAQELETLYKPTFFADNIVNLGFAQIYLTLMIDGIGSKPFSARTIEPVNTPKVVFTKEIIDYSRRKYSKPRAEVEDLVKSMGVTPNRSNKKSKSTKTLNNNQKPKKSISKHTNTSNPQTKSNKASLELREAIKRVTSSTITTPTNPKQTNVKSQEITAGTPAIQEVPKQVLKAVLESEK